MANEHYNCIVIGIGGVGSAALCHLASRGLKTLGIDRFGRAHDSGSSHGETRIIRLAYFEHPHYVPLLHHAYTLWAELSQAAQEKLYHEVGVLEIGPPDGEVIPGVLRSARDHSLEVEELDRDTATARFPGLRIPPGSMAVFERQAGYLRVEACVEAHLRIAERHGAEIRTHQAVNEWRADGAGVTVQAGNDRFTADRLVITSGAWASSVLDELNLPLKILRKSMFWYATDSPHHTAAQGFPGFFYEEPEGMFYGFPASGSGGLKVAEHSRGHPLTDPLSVDRDVDPGEQRRIEAFLHRNLAGVSRQLLRHATCFYTMTPNGNFIVDRHPEHPQVCFAAGLCGHGFKLTSVLGEVLSDLAQTGATKHPVEFLSLANQQL